MPFGRPSGVARATLRRPFRHHTGKVGKPKNLCNEIGSRRTVHWQLRPTQENAMKLQTPLRASGAMALALGFGLVGLGVAANPSRFPPPSPQHALFVETDATNGNSV